MGNTIDRRNFFKLSGISILGMTVLSKVKPVFAGDAGKKKYWNDEGCFHQDTIDISQINEGKIRVKGLNLDGWKTYSVVQTEEWFQEWNFSERVERIDSMINNPSAMPQWGGAHNPSVASYSRVLPEEDAFNRTQFSLNNAIKGMGLAPKKSTIDDVIQSLYDHWEDAEEDRLLHLRSLYTNRDLWDMSKQISLELYATPTRLTHSFINWMHNPLSNICFMGLRMRFPFPPYNDPTPVPGMPWMPTYELRTAAHMIHPMDPAFGETDYEFKLIKFSNTVHDFYHHQAGQMPPQPEDMDIGVIHYVLEEFDNDFIMGKSKRVAMLRILDWPRKMYARLFEKTRNIFTGKARHTRIA